VFIVFKKALLYHKSKDVNIMNIEQIYKTHKETFNSQVTKNVEKRKQVLEKILRYLEDHEDDINAALLKDLGKQRAEAYLSEIGMIYDTMSYIQKNIDKWTKPRKVGSTIKSFYYKSAVLYEPYGNVLVMAPWNYPFLLTMEPAINAIAAGNTVVIKPSEYAEETTKFLLNMAQDVDEPGIFSVVD
jgi:aldehyde dehydrogenase (NAD+)